MRTAESKVNIIEKLSALSDAKVREVEAEILGYIRGREDEREAKNNGKTI